ncbi:MAG TPA: type II secretion system F family protein [Acidimicrobiales bacterium]|nr:type II secretion system F family protein [Acidimicrobiales bacterium]
MIGLILAGCLLSSALFVRGAADLIAGAASRRAWMVSLADDEPTPASRLARLDRAFRRTAPGARLSQEMVLAGSDHLPVVVFACAAGGGLVAAYFLWVALAPVFAVAGLLAAFAGVRGYLGRGRNRRQEAFIAQMPQLARVLANALDAGRSITSSVAIAGEALEDPAGSEMRRVANRLRVDASVEAALNELRHRLPSREVAVLVSTLVISARSGGALVASLREIAATLEDRKEVRREVRTTLAQALFTGYVVVAMGFGMLFMLNAMRPGTVRAMTGNLLGQAALVVAIGLFGLGLLAIRRITSIEP